MGLELQQLEATGEAEGAAVAMPEILVQMEVPMALQAGPVPTVVV